MNSDVMFSSKSDMWETPQDFFNTLDCVFHFTLDVCATPKNAKCKEFFSPDQDGLLQEWRGVCWMNPPYGRDIGKWVCKAFESGKQGATIVCLLPARTDTKWWHSYCMRGEITFLRGRLKFQNGNHKTSSAPFPSAIVVFRPTVADAMSL